MDGLDPTLLALLIPILVLQLGLLVAGLWDLTRPGRQVRGDSKLLWGLVIVVVNIIGPLLYFVVGREEVGPDSETRPAGPPGPGAIAGWRAPRLAADVASPPTEAQSSPALAELGPTAVRRPARDRSPLPDAPPAITCRGLSKRYGGGDGVLALDGLDLDVPTGSVFGLLGPNGAGKTTTLRLLTGLGHATGGSATVAGVGIDDGGPMLAHRIGYLDQDPRYYGWMTGRELVTLVARLHGLDEATRPARVAEVLDQVGLASAADRRVSTYSGGMRQRLGIAQALVNGPPLLILDEPVSSLDPEGRRDLLELIADLRGSATVLFSTHVLADVERVCDRVAILDHGRLVTEGALDELLDHYAQPIYRIEPEAGQAAAVDGLVARLRAEDWVSAIDESHGEIRVTVADPSRAATELLPSVVAAGVSLAAFERVRPTLEDVFLRLVGRGTGEDRS